jgi:hypothetical protein
MLGILHNKELYALYSSPNIIRVMKPIQLRWERHVACMGGRRGTYRVFVGKPEGNRALGRPRHRWEDTIKMDLREVGWGMDWIDLAQDRDRWWAVVNAVMNLQALKMWEISQVAENLLASQKALCSVELQS